MFNRQTRALYDLADNVLVWKLKGMALQSHACLMGNAPHWGFASLENPSQFTNVFYDFGIIGEMTEVDNLVKSVGVTLDDQDNQKWTALLDSLVVCWKTRIYEQTA